GAAAPARAARREGGAPLDRWAVRACPPAAHAYQGAGPGLAATGRWAPVARSGAGAAAAPRHAAPPAAPGRPAARDGGGDRLGTGLAVPPLPAAPARRGARARDASRVC